MTRAAGDVGEVTAARAMGLGVVAQWWGRGGALIAASAAQLIGSAVYLALPESRHASRQADAPQLVGAATHRR